MAGTRDLILSERVLNRTLLQRQHLLERSSLSALEMVEHVLGLQAQDVLPPYISLWSRIEGFDPMELSELLSRREAVRLLLMRGTIHLVSATDALTLRPFVQPMLDKVATSATWGRHTADLAYADLAAAGRSALEDGPLTPKALGLALAARFPGYEPGHLANTVRAMLPLVQLPPRGLWKRSGGQTYEPAESWLGAELRADLDPRDVVRRYLRAFGPAAAADFTTWSGVTGTRAVLGSMKDEIRTYRDEAGRALVDLDGLPLADPDTPAPVRLLGQYDNLWLSHADRARVTEPGNRKRWMGPNGGVGNTVFVDGMLEGLWRQVDGSVEVELFRSLTKAETRDLGEEVSGLAAFLSR